VDLSPVRISGGRTNYGSVYMFPIVHSDDWLYLLPDYNIMDRQDSVSLPFTPDCEYYVPTISAYIHTGLHHILMSFQDRNRVWIKIYIKSYL
jgi:hypothetical protein